MKLAPEKGPHHPAKTKASFEDGANTPHTDVEPEKAFDDAEREVEVHSAEGEQHEGLKPVGEGQHATQTLPNDEDPTAGYITVGDVPHDKGETSPGNPSGTEFEKPAGMNPAEPLVEPTREIEDAPNMSAEIPAAAPDTVDEFDDAVDEPGVTIPDPDEVPDAEILEEAPGEDDMAIVDIDETPEEDCDDVVFANTGNGTVLALKGKRVIASMDKRAAIKAGAQDMYQSENYAEVTQHEMGRQGLRAGLKSMGFVLATVNVGKAEVLNKRVEAKAKKLTAGLRAVAAEQDESMEQCLAIAAVGINRAGYFKDVRNELRAALEDEFAAAGVRNADKLIRRVFASHGVDYAKAILTIANQLKDKPVEVRNSHASALDMLGDEEHVKPDLEDDGLTEAGHDEPFADEYEDDARAPVSVEAALRMGRPGYASPRRVFAGNNGGAVSVTAAAILSGNAKLPFSAF